jgi:hypothetical protein
MPNLLARILLVGCDGSVDANRLLRRRFLGEAVLRVASVLCDWRKGRNPRPSEAFGTRPERIDERLERSAANRSG